MKIPSLLCLILGLALAGCLPSLQPLYTANDTLFDPLLVDTWVDKDGKNTWQFQAADENQRYRLTVTDEKGQTGAFVVHLLKLGDVLYLDLFPDEVEIPANDFYRWHLQPLHTIMRVRQISPNLQMAMLNPNHLKKEFEANPTALAHDQAGGRTILTASTAELQRYLQAQAGVPELWTDYMDLLPKQVTPAAAE